jgi:RNA polymerase sigma-70 factor (ECF subfamily)
VRAKKDLSRLAVDADSAIKQSMSDDTQVLIESARAGDLPAASELVNRFYRRIFAYLRRLCGNDADAADLTQRTFSKAWQSLASFQQRSTFSTWLHAIAHHVYVDWRRKRNLGDARSSEWWEARVASQPTPSEDAAERELAHQLYRWVDELDEDKKQVVHLHYYQHFSLSETAEALGIATSTVKYRLREALDFLRAKAVEPKLSMRGERHE